MVPPMSSPTSRSSATVPAATSGYRKVMVDVFKKPTTTRAFLYDNDKDNDMNDKDDETHHSIVATTKNSTLFSNPIANSLGPVSLLGGSAAIYSSLLQHPSSTLTHMSFIFMMLLALQYALQPRLSRKYISPKLNKQSVALVEEIVKTSMAAIIFCSKPKAAIQHSLREWSLSSSLAVAGLPAMLYALQGVLQYVSHQHLDPVTFNGLTQTKTLSAAFCCWLIMGKMQSPVQVVALGILFGSALIFQGYHTKFGMSLVQRSNNVVKAQERDDDVTNKDTSHLNQDDVMLRGVIPCLGAAFLSGLAGALSQKGLQLSGNTGRDPYLYTIEISFYSAITLLISMMRSSVSLPFSTVSSPTRTINDWSKQRSYWNVKTLIPIFFKAAGGVITALVHKYAGSVAKGFGLMFGLVVSGMIQLTLSQEYLQPHQVMGTLMIMMSTWLHFTHPPLP